MKILAKTVGTLGLMGCAVMYSQFAVADDSPWYGGVNIGQTRAEIDDERITARLVGGGSTAVSIVDDDKDIGFKLFGGYKFNKNFALEGGYFDLGKFGYTATTVPAGTLSGQIKLKGLNLDAVGFLPFAENFSAFGRVGAQYAQAKDNFSSTGSVVTPADPNPKKNAINYKYGAGLQYDFTESLGMRLEAERYRINDGIGNKGDIDMLSVGLVFGFGKDKPAPTKVEKPRPVAKAPVRVIVPVKVKTAKYCSILDIAFEIKQDEIQREEKERLAVLGTYMKKYPETTALIEGHTDNVGTSEYNLKLSLQRAESVVNYLADDLKIDRSRLTAVGYGETRPIADNSTAEGKQMNRRIDAVIACVTDIADLKVVAARTTMAMEIEFDPDKAEILPEYRAGLQHVANFMKANPAITATVEGHASKYTGAGKAREQETAEESMKLSQKRAQNVVNYMVNNLGIARSRLSTAAFGQTRRVDYGITEEGQQENRRVNIIFNYRK